MRLRTTIICFLLFVSAFSQEALKTERIVGSYKQYVTQPREIVYAHLNKSTYIKGEDIGFTAYVLNKLDKKLSSITTNLYCAILDKEENVLKEKLLKVDNGIVNNQFSVDSLFTSEEYKFVAYTNWMKNFDEQNFFTASIKVIDPDVETTIKNKEISTKIDTQFLPEGGHLISDVENVIFEEFGVIDWSPINRINEEGECSFKIRDTNTKIITLFIEGMLNDGSFVLETKKIALK